jgi:hypothetical protein
MTTVNHMSSSKELSEKLDQLVRSIVAYFPIGWRVTDSPEDMWAASAWRHARGPEPESEITFYATWREKRLSVSGAFPKSFTDSTAFGPPFKVERPSASVAMDRPPQKLAADLLRRVVWPYLAILEESLKRRDAYDADRALEREISLQLAAVIDSEADPSKFPSNYKQWYGNNKVYCVRVSADALVADVNLELHHLPVPLADKIVRLVKEHYAEQQAELPAEDQEHVTDDDERSYGPHHKRADRF